MRETIDGKTMRERAADARAQVLKELLTRALSRRDTAAVRGLPVLNLALQGGGAHGAFTWGVLDRLIQERDFRFEGISGTSAGAMNAVVAAAGWLDGGREGARAALAELWHRVAELARFSPLRQGKLPQVMLDLTAHVLSPYQLNPLGINPLRELLTRLVDFERLRAAHNLRLYIAATNLRTGHVRIFERHEIDLPVVLASTCLPEVYQAVEIGGEAYWDGGYVSNPPLLPLIQGCSSADVLLIQINPLAAPGLPTGAGAIRNRIGEIVFGQPLARELELLAERRARARAPLARLRRENRRYAQGRLHVLDGSPALARLEPMTKAVPDRPTIALLRQHGRLAAGAWLEQLARGVAPVQIMYTGEPEAQAALRRSA